MKMMELNVGVTQVGLTAYLHPYSAEMEKFRLRPAVIICAGGGYSFRSKREEDPVALRFFSAGYQTFVLDYSVRKPESAPLGMRPLTELSCAVSDVRRNAAEYGVDEKKIAVCGFSAGGHLAASLGVHWDAPRLRAQTGGEGACNRPDALVLCYPVITAGAYQHGGSIDNLTGGCEEDLAFFSLENHIGEKTPPTFIWHTVADPGVAVENSLLFVMGLRRCGVPFECHLFENGGHGLSVCTREVGTSDRHAASWLPLCLEWLGGRFDFQLFDGS